MRILLFLITLLCALTLTLAQGTVITGKVVDENGLAMPGATIQLTNLDQVGAYSDGEGSFTIYNVPSGTHTISVTYIGYKSMSQEINAEAGLLNLSFQLDPGVTLGDEVIILGDRLKGQAKALNQQRSNDNITNIVAADQIGRFPDANVGDAMKRIPGITMQGDQGEARNIIIRGLAPQLNSVMINGNRIPSAEGDNRNVQMDLIPADMIQTIEVNKAITPDMDADAIGGSVNLVTRANPYGERISATLASGYNLLAEKPIWTGALIYGNRFLNDKLGAVASLSYNNHDFGSDNIEAEWDQDDEGAFVKSFETRIYEVQRIRRSASLNLDYNFNERNKVFLNSMYNWRDDWENRYREVIDDISRIEGNIFMAEKVERQTKGGLGNDRIDNRRLEDQRVIAFSGGGEHLLGNAELTWMAGYAKASEERLNERYAQFTAEPEFEEEEGEDAPLGILYRQNITNPERPLMERISNNGSFTQTDFEGNVIPMLGSSALSDLNNYELDEITEETQYTTDTDINGRIDLKLPIAKGFIKGGVSMRYKEKDRDNNFFEIDVLNDEFESLGASDVPRVDKTDPDFLPGAEYQAGEFASPTWLGGLNFNDDSRFEKESKGDEFVAGNYVADETVTAAYIMSKYNLTDKLSTTIGVRVENTNIEYTGNQFIEDNLGEDEEEIIQVSNSDNYTNVLPGIHLKYDLTDNFILRGAWTNSLARPNYFDLVPFADTRAEDEELFLGNPELEPTTSMNFDFMSELYFKSIGLISAGYFHKEIDDFIYVGQSENADGFNVFQPQNGSSGTINGIEISAQRQLDFLPGMLKGFGVYLNYTYTSSDVSGIANEDGEERNDVSGLPGTAENLFNASLSFETEKLVLRASINYSSDYVDELGGDAFTDRYYDKQTFVDLNASYAFTPKWRIFFEANNITNQPLRFYQGVSSRTMQEEFYNARFNVGVKFDSFGR